MGQVGAPLAHLIRVSGPDSRPYKFVFAGGGVRRRDGPRVQRQEARLIILV